MAKVHRIHSMTDDAPWAGGLPPQGSPEHPRTIRALDGVLRVQRPAVVAHLRSIRLRHPNASTAEIVRMLERRYLAAVTTGGAAVGATAVVPGITTGVTLALSGVETVVFLDATALFAQSLAELHGIPVDDPDRARALVLTLMLGQEGVDLAICRVGITEMGDYADAVDEAGGRVHGVAALGGQRRWGDAGEGTGQPDCECREPNHPDVTASGRRGAAAHGIPPDRMWTRTRRASS